MIQTQGDAGMKGSFASRVSGSADLYKVIIKNLFFLFLVNFTSSTRPNPKSAEYQHVRRDSSVNLFTQNFMRDTYLSIYGPINLIRESQRESN